MIEAETGPDAGAASCRRSSSSAARRRSTWPRRWPPAGVPLLGADLEAIDQAEERTRFAAPARPARHPAARGRHGATASRRRSRSPSASATRSSSGRPSSSAGWPSTSATRRRPRPAAGRRDRRRSRTGRSGSTAISRASRWTSMPCRTATDVLIPGLLEHVERAGVHSGDSVGVFPPQAVSRGRPGPDRGHDGADRPRARRARAWSMPSSSSATTACTCSRSTRGRRGPCRSCPR